MILPEVNTGVACPPTVLPKWKKIQIGAFPTIGLMLLHLRTQRRYTLDEAATAIGCSKSYLWALEKDRSEPSLRTAKAIAEAYAVPIDKLAACLNTSD